MKEKRERIIIIVLSVILGVLVINIGIMRVKAVIAPYIYRPTIVIDAGHGGMDPGKVGVNDALEKDINLAITHKLKTFLEQQDYNVVLTRSEDVGLYKQSDSNKKRTDLLNRKNIINNSRAVAVVSIHQNSFPQGKYKGSQVFYYTNSEKGELLAKFIQDEMIRVLDPSNKRLHKANNDYYIIKESKHPAVIVECGFLSNWEEAEMLTDVQYQEKIAWAIHLGIVKFVNEQKKEPVLFTHYN